MICWEQLYGRLDPIFLSNQRYRMKWDFEKNGEYSTKSMCKWLAFTGFMILNSKGKLKLNLHAKTKVFVWQLIHDRLPTREQNSNQRMARVPSMIPWDVLIISYFCVHLLNSCGLIRELQHIGLLIHTLSLIWFLSLNIELWIFFRLFVLVVWMMRSLWTIRNKLIF